MCILSNREEVMREGNSIGYVDEAGRRNMKDKRGKVTAFFSVDKYCTHHKVS